MDSTQRRYSAAAWSLLDALSGLRKSVQGELDFFHAIASGLSVEKLEIAMLEIDFITSEISNYLGRLPDMQEEEMEGEHQVLFQKYDVLERMINDLLDH